MTTTFRDDIQGLRAIAIMAVVTFHIGPKLFSGGYVGVDVFYVISGYLITSGIIARFEAGRWSLADFYARRIRRLFPALIFTILVTLALAAFFMLPHEIENVARSSISSLLYVSNIFFMLSSGYFDAGLESNPLLHTWSLSVEEQFYIVFPFLVVLSLGGGRRRLFAVLGILALASFLLAQWLLTVNDAWAFFLSPARFWQFVCGAVLTLIPRVSLPGTARDGIAISGVAAIAVSCFVLDGATPVPGFALLPATLGASAIILAGIGGAGPLSRLLLGNPVATFIGKISYSTYLLHWPIIVFYELYVFDTTVLEQAGLLAASLVAGTLCWRFIEQPFMHLRIEDGRRMVTAGVGATAAVAGLAVALLAFDGLERRFTPQQVALSRTMESLNERMAAEEADTSVSCFLSTSRQKSVDAFDRSACVPAGDSRPRIALVGDSHANHYVPGITEAVPAAGFARIMASGCRPLLEGDGNPVCRALMDEAFTEILPQGDFDLIVLAARWRGRDAEALRETAVRLAAVTDRVVVLGPIVEYHMPLPRILAMQAPDEADAGNPGLSLLAEKRRLDQRLREALATDTKVHYLSVLDAMCPRDRCLQMTANGVPVQYDYGHLTPDGSVEVVQRLAAKGLFAGVDLPASRDNYTVSNVTR